MIFLFPLVFSVVSVAFYVFAGESTKLKIAAIALVAISVVLQFVPGLQVHFLIPLSIQLFLCICFAIYWQANR